MRNRCSKYILVRGRTSIVLGYRRVLQEYAYTVNECGRVGRGGLVGGVGPAGARQVGFQGGQLCLQLLDERLLRCHLRHERVARALHIAESLAVLPLAILHAGVLQLDEMQLRNDWFHLQASAEAKLACALAPFAAYTKRNTDTDKARAVYCATSIWTTKLLYKVHLREYNNSLLGFLNLCNKKTT